MMAYKGYLAHITFDAQANLFHGEVINIRDVVTFQGQSVDELRQALADSVEDYLAFCAERGEAPDQPFSGGSQSACRRSSIARSFWQPRRLAKT